MFYILLTGKHLGILLIISVPFENSHGERAKFIWIPTLVSPLFCLIFPLLCRVAFFDISTIPRSKFSLPLLFPLVSNYLQSLHSSLSTKQCALQCPWASQYTMGSLPSPCLRVWKLGAALVLAPSCGFCTARPGVLSLSAANALSSPGYPMWPR